MNKIRRQLGRLWDTHAGGALPVVTGTRGVHAVETTYKTQIGWLRRSFTFGYVTPRLPRAVRHIRAAESARLQEQSRRFLAGEPLVRVGDLIPEHAGGILPEVLEFVDCEGDTWRRPAGDERYYRADPAEGPQTYDWVTSGGWSTTEGRLAYAPLRVTKVADPINVGE